MFAYYYDLLMEDVDYEYILEPLLPYINKNQEILDAGCGTGHILSHLLNKGYNIKGIDIDEEMLLVANKKIDQPNILFYHDLNEKLPTTFDAILMLFDVTNYFENPKNVFINIYEGLNPEGTFVFDVYKKEYLKEMESYREEDDIPFKYTWDTQSKDNILEHHFKTDTYELKFKQYLYSNEYYESLLNSIGFKFKKINGNDERKVYYICHK